MPKGLGVGKIWRVDGRVDAFFQHEAVDNAAGVLVANANDLSRIVDVGGLGIVGAGIVDIRRYSCTLKLARM